MTKTLIRSWKRKVRAPLLRALRGAAWYRALTRVPREEILACRDYVRGHADRGAALVPLDAAAQQALRVGQDGPGDGPRIFGSLLGFDLPETFVATLPECRLYGRGVAVVGADGSLIAEGSAHIGGTPADHAIRGRAFLPRPRRLPGTTAVLSAPAGNTYYHWLFDVLPRIALLRRAGVDLAGVDRFAVNSLRQSFQRETLARIGIPQDRIVETDVVNHVVCERMLLPSYPGISGFPPRWACDFLREQLGATSGSPRTPESIYVSRQRSSSRRLANEDEIRAVLGRAGFETYYPEEHSVAEQAAAFARARRVVALHGSGLSNLVFCSPGSRVIELFPPIKVTVAHYAVLSGQVGLRYQALVGQLCRDDDPHGDITIRPDALAALL